MRIKFKNALHGQINFDNFLRKNLILLNNVSKGNIKHLC